MSGRRNITVSNRRDWSWWQLSYSTGDDDGSNPHMTIVGFGWYISIPTPRLIPPYREKVVAKYWDEATIARMGRDWYWNTDRREFGVSLFGNMFSVFYGRQADSSKEDRRWNYFLPWMEWRFVRFSLYGLRGEHFWTRGGSFKHDEQRRAEEAVPKVRFAFDDYDGQRIEATTHIEEREWTLGTKWCAWLRFFARPKVRRCLRIKFSEEVGPEKGSWKGGTVGHGIDMLPGELHEAAFRRYCEQEHRSRRGAFRIKFVEVLA